MAETVIRQRATVAQDRYGEDVLNWASPTTATYTVRGVEPVSSSEDNNGRQAVITGHRVYLDHGVDVLPGDRMVLRGVTYEVNGSPADWRAPWGSDVGGVVVALKAVTG